LKKVIKKACTFVLCGTLAVQLAVPNMKLFSCDTVLATTMNEGEFFSDGMKYSYVIENSGLTLTNVVGEGNLSIPSEVKIDGQQYSVKALGNRFGEGNVFADVIVPDSVIKIGDSVFVNTTMDSLTLSSNLETIGDWFCAYSYIKNSVNCKSRKISKIDENCFAESKGTEKVILDKWLIKYKCDENVFDLSSEELEKVKYAENGTIEICDNVDTLKIGENDYLLNRNFYKSEYYKIKCYKNIANVYVNGEKVRPKDEKDAVPSIIKQHYDMFAFSKFDKNYANEKAEKILNSLGITYYGENGYLQKGKLTGAEEYNIALKVHDYLVNNFVYDKDKSDGPYTKVFNCNTETICTFDAEMYAFLLESAGVEADTVASIELLPCSDYEKETVSENTPYYYFKGEEAYKRGRYGDHAWNVIVINGVAYYVDLTHDRAQKTYNYFLYSDEMMDNYMELQREDKDYKGNTLAHEFPHFMFYNREHRDSGLFWFQSYGMMLEVPRCYKTFGDVDKSQSFRDQNDMDMLQAYTLVAKDTRDKIEHKNITNSQQIIMYSKEETDAMNKIIVNGKIMKLTDSSSGWLQFLFDIHQMDINFDGEIDMVDVINFNHLLQTPIKESSSKNVKRKPGSLAPVADKNNGVKDDKTKDSALKGVEYKAHNLRYVVIDDKIDGTGKVVVAGMNKVKSNIIIPKNVKIIGHNYRVVGVYKNAFKGQKNLKKIVVKSKNIITVGKNAFKNINMKAKFFVPKSCFKKYKKLFNKKAGVTKSMKIKRRISKECSKKTKVKK